MKYLITYIVLSIIASVTLLGQYQYKISLEMDKTKYIVGETIQVGISIINISSTTLNEEINKTIVLNIKNKNGGLLKPWGTPIENKLPSIYGLKPNQEVYEVLEVSSHFGKIYGPVGAANHYFDPGVYIIIISFAQDGYFAMPSELEFQVEEPFGEEKLVYENYVDLVKGTSSGKFTMNQLIEGYEKLHRAYPTSVYTPILLSELYAGYSIITLEKEKANNIRKEFVEKYPSSLRSFIMIDGLLKNLSSTEEKIKFMENMDKNIQSGLIKKLAGKQIELLRITN